MLVREAYTNTWEMEISNGLFFLFFSFLLLLVPPS